MPEQLWSLSAYPASLLAGWRTHLELDNLVQQDKDGRQMGKVPCRKQHGQPGSSSSPSSLPSSVKRHPAPREKAMRTGHAKEIERHCEALSIRYGASVARIRSLASMSQSSSSCSSSSSRSVGSQIASVESGASRRRWRAKRAMCRRARRLRWNLFEQASVKGHERVSGRQLMQATASCSCRRPTREGGPIGWELSGQG